MFILSRREGKTQIVGVSPINILQAEAVSAESYECSFPHSRIINKLLHAAGVKLLDQKKIHGIRCELLIDVDAVILI